MCGRFDLHSPPRRWAALLGASLDARLDTCVAPSYNVAPGRTVLIAVARDSGGDDGGGDSRDGGDGSSGGAVDLEAAVWGVPAPWPDRRRPTMLFNARVETLATKAPFRYLLADGRCLVAADGFYEWRPDPGSKRRQPFYFCRADGQPLLFAGLRTPPAAQAAGRPAIQFAGRPATRPAGARAVQRAGAPTAEPTEMSGTGAGAIPTASAAGGTATPTGRRAPGTACTVVTTAANEDVASIHHRMPAVLDVDSARRWLGVDEPEHRPPRGTIPDLAELVAPAGTLVARPVTVLVNDPRHDGPELLADPPAPPLQVPPTLFG